jgi:cytidylate kinase
VTKKPTQKEEETLIITLDGPSGSGKSTISHLIAQHFQVPCLDTGAMYRTVALLCLNRGISLEDESKVLEVAQGIEFRFSYLPSGDSLIESSIDGKTWSRVGKEIRTPEVSLAASQIAKMREVRAALVAQQQRIGRAQGAVVEGRDAGTVIFPQAPYKFFMTASVEARAQRRYLELKDKLGAEAPSLESVQKEMIQRDEQDSGRAESPLKPADDAQYLDTTGLSLNEVFQNLVTQIEARRRLH